MAHVPQIVSGREVPAQWARVSRKRLFLYTLKIGRLPWKVPVYIATSLLDPTTEPPPGFLRTAVKTQGRSAVEASLKRYGVGGVPKKIVIHRDGVDVYRQPTLTDWLIGAFIGALTGFLVHEVLARISIHDSDLRLVLSAILGVAVVPQVKELLGRAEFPERLDGE